MKYFSFLISLFILISCSDKHKEITLNANNVNGLETNAKISVNGLEIGFVKDLILNTDGTISILCKINSDSNIPSDSKFKIENEGLLESKRITVELGKNTKKIENGDIFLISDFNNSTIKGSIEIIADKIFENLNDNQKNDSILIELRRLNENIEKINK